MTTKTTEIEGTAEDMERSRRWMERLIEEGIKPYAHAFAEIHVEGGIAVCVYDIDHGNELVRKALEAMGYTGAPVFRLPAKTKSKLRDADRVTRAWCDRKGPGRIFVVANSGTLLVNFAPGLGFSLEPGSCSLDPRAPGNGWLN